MRTLGLASLTAVFVLAGCAPSLGECDPVEARRVVYTADGLPTYEGQAIVAGACASCHSALNAQPATRAFRNGAPFTLNFDVAPLRSEALCRQGDPTCPEARLRAGRASVLRYAYEIVGSMESGFMPPRTRPAPGLNDFRANAYPCSTADDTPVDRARFEEPARATAIVRNWLACGAPIVARTRGVAGDLGDRVPALDQVIDPRWDGRTGIYTRVIGSRCASSVCHNGSGAQGPAAALDFTTEAKAWRALCDATPDTEALPDTCEAVRSVATFSQRDVVSGQTTTVACGRSLVVAGNADRSLLVEKVESQANIPDCGAPMPFGTDRLEPKAREAIRAWVLAGAARGTPATGAALCQ